jgi:hypothetical protein
MTIEPHIFIPKRNRLKLEVKVLKSILHKIKGKSEGSKRSDDRPAPGPCVVRVDDLPMRGVRKPEGFGQVGGIRVISVVDGIYEPILKRHF